MCRGLATDPDVPRGVRVRMGLLVGYLLMPIDLVPDFVPVVGYADDAIVVVWALRSVVRAAGPDALDRHWSGTPAGLRAVKRLAGVPADPADRHSAEVRASHSMSGRSAFQSARTSSSKVGGVDDGLEGVGLPGVQRLVPQQVDAAVLGVVPARGGLEPLAAQLPAGLGQLVRDAGQLGAGLVVGHGVAVARPAVGPTCRSSRRRCGPRARRSRRTNRWPARRRRTRPGWSCTASCPWRTARRGRAGTPCRTGDPRRTPERGPTPARPSAPSRPRRRSPCASPSTTWCCRPRGRRRSRERRRGSLGSRSPGSA